LVIVKAFRKSSRVGRVVGRAAVAVRGGVGSLLGIQGNENEQHE
jgi:hypothetical protein